LRTPWAAAELIPARLVLDLFHGKPPVDDHWRVDGASRCLVPVERNQPWPGPLRPTRRWAAAVDRFTGTAAAYDTGCVEFHPTAGWWCACDFAGPADRERWTPRLQGAWRLLADTGLGGERSRGWGRFTQPEFREGELTELLFGKTFEATSSSHWLLSLFRPAEQDQVEWQRGAYQLVSRSGRVESPAAWSGWVEWGVEKASSALVSEGSVLVSRAPLTGSALDVAPAGFPHPVFRAGFALAVPIPEPAQS
jgi:CRISPR type III-A-associated RAMP protein Csm4